MIKTNVALSNGKADLISWFLTLFSCFCIILRRRSHQSWWWQYEIDQSRAAGEKNLPYWISKDFWVEHSTWILDFQR